MAPSAKDSTRRDTDAPVTSRRGGRDAGATAPLKPIRSDTGTSARSATARKKASPASTRKASAVATTGAPATNATKKPVKRKVSKTVPKTTSTKPAAVLPKKAPVKRGSSVASNRQDADKGKTSQQKTHKGGARRILFRVGVVLACLTVAVVIIYPVAKNYYTTIREYDKFEAELVALNERNEKIGNQIASLETDEGVEDRAREEFGWVKEGENAVNVTGLEGTDSSTALPETVESESITAESTWVTDTLDVIFGLRDISSIFEEQQSGA